MIPIGAPDCREIVRHKEYLGIGAGAVGYKNKTRYYPHKDIEEYIKNPLYSDNESLTDEDIKMEKVLLGLRSELGVDLELFSTQEKLKIDELIKDNKIKVQNNKIYNNDFLLSDALALHILE